MDKIIAIKIKNTGGGYDEIPITALAQNVYWNSNLNLNLKQHIIGDIDEVIDENHEIIPLQTQIKNLKTHKANIDAPNFTGVPTINDNELNPNTNNQIATKGYVNNQTAGQLKTSDLYTSSLSALTSNSPTNVTGQQYPVIFDSERNLSVNVPWENTVFSSSIDNLWTGMCSDLSSTVNKNIILDSPSNFPSESELEGGEMLAIYFKEGNTANNPKISINNINYSIGFLKTDGTIQQLTNINPFYKFGSGLKFFVYKINYDGNDNNCWLLSTTDYSIISYLNDNKANLNSPVFTGTPQIKINGVNRDVATTTFVNSQIENQLTTSRIKGETTTNFTSQITNESNKQYSVVFDSDGYLSVNVPWIDPGNSIANTQKIWTGVCNETEENESQKFIILNNENNNYGGMIGSLDGTPYIIEGSNILIYFKYGNNVASPTIVIRGIEDLEKDILYQSGPNTFSKIKDVPYYQWGPGFKIFTYVKYTENNEQKDGWVINSFDGLIIKNLNDRLNSVEIDLNEKVNRESPSLRGIPTSPFPNGETENQIATVKYVQEECQAILKADSNYAFQLKSKNNNNKNIFAVDWDGNVNEINLNCFYTEGIKKSNPETTIIGKYNEVTKNATGLYCDDSIICQDDLMVGGLDISYDSGNYIFVIGSGTDDENRFNALTVTPGGGIYSPGIYNNVAKEITVGQTPSEHYYRGGFILRDSKYFDYANFMHTYLNDGRLGFRLQVKRLINDVNIYNQLSMYIDNNGNQTVTFSHPYAWQKAMYLDAVYSSPNNPTVGYRTVVLNEVPCAGFISNGSKQIMFFLPHNVTSGNPKIVNLALIVRGGAGQEYLYEASGPSNTTYTRLATDNTFGPVTVWENGKTKRTNGVETIQCNIRRASGFKVVVNFKNTLRKSASTTVAQNNAPCAIIASLTIQLT